MEMKMTKKDVYLLLTVLGVLIAFCAYYFGFKKNMEEAQALTEESATLESRVSVLEGYEANYDAWQSEIYTMADEIDTTLAKFPADVRPEDAVSDFIRMQDNSGAGTIGIEYGAAEDVYNLIGASTDQIFADAESKDREHYDVDDWMDKRGLFELLIAGELVDGITERIENGELFTFGSDDEDWEDEDWEDEDTTLEEDVEAAAAGETTEYSEGAPALTDANGNPIPTNGSGIFLRKQPIGYAMQFDVPQMKSAVATILDDPDRTAIEEIGLVFDASTGALGGELKVNKYYIVGANGVYEQPDFSGVSIGTSNLFSTIEKKNTDNEE